jgi:integrase
MTDSVKVSVVKYPDRENLVLRWRDPTNGKWRCKSAETTNRRQAERKAGSLEREILEGQHGPTARMSWSDFREYHEKHCLSAMKDKSVDAYAAALDVYERFHKPDRLSSITAARVTAWQTHLRTEGKADATIATYTRHLKAVLNWAKSQGLLAIVPNITMPKRVKGAKQMKGRPITLEEFERMLTAVAKVVAPKPVADADPARAAEQATAIVESWKYYLRGLWLSGLRLSESLTVEWGGNKPSAIVVDFSHKRPMLRIPAEAEKGNKDRLLPMAPEFAEFLAATPEAERRGRVFKLVGKLWPDARMQADWVSRVVCQIGRKARVVVDERQRRLTVDARRETAKPKPAKAPGNRKSVATADDGMKRKYASAHDLRRAFGLRWSARVMPAVLQQLMRHESIETTMRYYVGRDADAVADVLWHAVENGTRPVSVTAKAESTKVGNTSPATANDGAKQKPQTLTGKRLKKSGRQDLNLRPFDPQTPNRRAGKHGFSRCKHHITSYLKTLQSFR